MSQNLYFVGLVLTQGLWAAVLKMRQTLTLIVHLVLSLGIYFSFFAACCALANLHPTLYSRVSALFPVVGCLLPLSWAYAFWRVPLCSQLVAADLVCVMLMIAGIVLGCSMVFFLQFFVPRFCRSR